MDEASFVLVASVSVLALLGTFVLSGERWRLRAAPVHPMLAGVLGTVASLGPVRRAQEAEVRARRRAECLSELPVMLDVVTLGLSAGLSFDSSLELYCERYGSELSRLFSSRCSAGASARAAGRRRSRGWRTRSGSRPWEVRRRGVRGAGVWHAPRRGAGAAGAGHSRGAALAGRGGDREGAGEDARSAGDAHCPRDVSCHPGPPPGVRAGGRMRARARERRETRWT